MAPIPTNTPDLKESCGPTPKGSWRGCWRLLCLMFSIAVASNLLCRSGDVETNPGPPQFDLVFANLPQLRDLLRDTQTQWFNLGLELGVNLTTLKTIETDYQKVDRRFLEMLSAWLHMVPQQSWESLVTALKRIGHANLAESIKDRFGITVRSVVSNGLPAVRKKSAGILDTDELESKFTEIARNTFKIIKEGKTDLLVFKANLLNLPLWDTKQHQEFLTQLWPQITNATLEDIWSKLQLYWNFLNYTLLEHLVREFGDETLKTKMDEYKRELREFRCTTHLCDFARQFDLDFKLLEAKFSRNWEECTLEDLENWKKGITQKILLPSFYIEVRSIESDGRSLKSQIPPRQLPAPPPSSYRYPQSDSHAVTAQRLPAATHEQDILNAIDGDTILSTKPDKYQNRVEKVIHDLTPPEVRALGLELGLYHSTLSRMSPDKIHGDMVHSWLIKSDDVPEVGGCPTWRSLAQGLAELRLWGIVDIIKARYPSTSMSHS